MAFDIELVPVEGGGHLQPVVDDSHCEAMKMSTCWRYCKYRLQIEAVDYSQEYLVVPMSRDGRCWRVCTYLVWEAEEASWNSFEVLHYVNRQNLTVQTSSP